MKELKIGDKTYTINEIRYVDILEWQGLGLSQNEITKKLLAKSTGISEEEINNLSLRDGISLQKVVNEVNGFDFQ